MPTLLDDILERHDGPEPRVLTVDVQAVLRRKVHPGEDGVGESVTLIAERAGVSPRTVYRALQADKETMSLSLADKLVLAAGSHPAMAGCRLMWPDGSVTAYARLDCEVD